jgi:hypothetical protein
MGIIGIVALNLTLGRAVYGLVPWRLAGVFLNGIVLQIGAFCLICSRGWRRAYAFWAGVVFGSLLGLTSFLYARADDSWVGALWETYANFIDNLLLKYFDISVINRPEEDPLLLAMVALFGFLPQFVMALLGGLLGLWLGWSEPSWRLVNSLLEILGILVANAALWFVASYYLPAQPRWLAVGIIPGALLLQLGLYVLIRSWRRRWSRAFWIGFVVVDSLVFWSYVKAVVFTNAQTAVALTYWPKVSVNGGRVPSAPLWALWTDYVTKASSSLGRPPYGTLLTVWTGRPSHSAFYALIVLLPHLMAALGGGLLAIVVTWLAGITRLRKGPAT